MADAGGEEDDAAAGGHVGDDFLQKTVGVSVYFIF